MSRLSKKRRSRSRRLGRIERDILEELSGGDMLYSILMSGRSTRTMYRIARERATARYRRKLAIERLRALEFIAEKGERLLISERGRSALGIAVESIRNKLDHTRWDGKWRIIAFDIPEAYATLRAKVREILKKAGFVKLQHSVWVFPHECDELSELIRKRSGLEKYILYGTLERVANAEHLKKRFRIS